MHQQYLTSSQCPFGLPEKSCGHGVKGRRSWPPLWISAVFLVLTLVSPFASALPTPKDIESAVNARQYVQAEAMLREVIKAKPQSAKAHYELGQVLAREEHRTEARQELLEAQRLDPALKFAHDPQHFHDLLVKLSEAPISHSSAVLRPVVSPTPRETPFPWGLLLIGIGVVIAVWLLINRSARSVGSPQPAGGYGNSSTPGGVGGVPQSSGSGMGGAIVGGIAGLAAGYGLSKLLDHGNDAQSASHQNSDSGYTPIDTGNSSDYGGFDAGSGDSWDDNSSSSSDDNW